MVAGENDEPKKKVDDKPDEDKQNARDMIAHQSYKAVETVFKEGQAHPTAIVESDVLASVPQLRCLEVPRVIKHLASTEFLSNEQVDVVVNILHTVSQHVEIDGEKFRKAFLLALATGMGKTRAIIAAFLASKKKAKEEGRRIIMLFLSASSLLLNSLEVELSKSGYEVLEHSVIDLKNAGAYSSLVLAEETEVIFSTYDTFRSTGTKKGPSRAKQIFNTLDKVDKNKYQIMICLDEAHKAKNNSGEGKTFKLVSELDKRYPDAIYIFSSATAISDSECYTLMPRLFGNLDFETMGELMKTLKSLPMTMKEMLPPSFKATGSYSAIQLSYTGVEFGIEQMGLNEISQLRHAKCSVLWQIMLFIFENYSEGWSTKKSPAVFWGANQRFNSELLSAFKVGTTFEMTKQLINAGGSVVISMTSTGEALTDRVKRRYVEEEEEGAEKQPAEPVSLLEILIDLVIKHGSCNISTEIFQWVMDMIVNMVMDDDVQQVIHDLRNGIRKKAKSSANKQMTVRYK